MNLREAVVSWVWVPTPEAALKATAADAAFVVVIVIIVVLVLVLVVHVVARWDHLSKHIINKIAVVCPVAATLTAVSCIITGAATTSTNNRAAAFPA